MKISQKKAQDSGKVLLMGTSDSALGGVERIIFGLTLALRSRGRAIEAVFPKTDRSDALRAWGIDQGVESELTTALLCIREPHGWADMLALRRFLRQSKPQVVNLHYGDNFISLKDVLAVRLAGVPRCYVTIHQAAPWQVLGAHKKRMTRHASIFCDQIIAICDATRGVLLEAGVRPNKIKMLYCGIPMPSRRPSRAEARRRLGLDDKDFIVATLCNLTPRKGVADLIDAASRVHDLKERMHLVIAGDGTERANLESQAARLLGEGVTFLGAITGDTADVYSAANVFVLPSHQEGLPLVYLEAAFHGIPIIATCVGGSPEAVLDGKTGLLVPPGDPMALADAIQRLRDDPDLCRRLGDAARIHVQENFTEQLMADRYESLFFGDATV